MSQYYNEDQQIEYIKSWWNRYGNAILSLVLATIVFMACWQGWQRYQSRHQEGASILYEALVTAIDNKDYDTAHNQAELLTKNFKRTIYASYANLILAKVAIDKREYEEAETYFNWVRRYSPSVVLKELAAVRHLRILVTQKKYQDALDIMEKHRFKVFEPLVDELRGDAELALGHRDNAKTAYKKALEASNIDRPILKMKLARIVNLDVVHMENRQVA